MDETELSPKEKEVYEHLKQVIDPELQVDLVDLGLIYGIAVQGNHCQITMTLTIMGCPLTDVLNHDIIQAATNVDGIEECEIKLVWYPQWNPQMMSRVARLTLGVH